MKHKMKKAVLIALSSLIFLETAGKKVYLRYPEQGRCTTTVKTNLRPGPDTYTIFMKYRLKMA